MYAVLLLSSFGALQQLQRQHWGETFQRQDQALVDFPEHIDAFLNWTCHVLYTDMLGLSKKEWNNTKLSCCCVFVVSVRVCSCACVCD